MKRLLWCLPVILIAAAILTGIYLGTARPSEGLLVLTLPEDLVQKQTGSETVSLLRSGELAGGIVRFRLPSPDCRFNPIPSTGEILGTLRKAEKFPNDHLDYGYMAESSLQADMQIEFVKGEQTYNHYLFFTETDIYDLWFDCSRVNYVSQSRILGTVAHPGES